jgi:hypothetical protein
MSRNTYPSIANEPKMPGLLRHSFAFVPSVGMRLAPEVLLLELYRETFFATHAAAASASDLDADKRNDGGEYVHTPEQRSVLHALRGRRRQTRNAREKPFFAPAYPLLAQNAWLRQRAERVIINLLFGKAPGQGQRDHSICAPISQALWWNGETDSARQKHAVFCGRLVQALFGANTQVEDDPKDKDILSVALGVPDPNELVLDASSAHCLVEDKTRSSVVMQFDDELANRILRDVLALCDLEGRVPRMHWLQILMTFLRFALPVWLLAQMRITELLLRWSIRALDEGQLTSDDAIRDGLACRNRSLLRPSLVPTRELMEHTEIYMRSRVELSILLNCLGMLADEIGADSNTLVVSGNSSHDLPVARLLQLMRDQADRLRQSSGFIAVADGCPIRVFLARKAEQFAAWRDPLKKGQGKNIDEFFRVLYRHDLGDEAGGHLLIPERRPRAFRTMPGQLLLKTITYLAMKSKQENGTVRGGGMLTLEDVESHFLQYGIDFSAAADARPVLMRELQSMGLLAGSPDAGSSVAVGHPF